MTDTWYAAFGLLATLSILNALVLIAVLRQVGVLHNRIPTVGPGQHAGPALGTEFPRLDLIPVSTSAFADPPVDPFESSLVLFGYVTPGCSLCHDLPPFFRAYLETKPARLELSAFLATDASVSDAQEFASSHISHDDHLPLYQQDDLQSALDLPGSPYVIAFGQRGPNTLVVHGAGVINTLEQLEELVDSAVDHAAEPPDLAVTKDGIRRRRVNIDELELHDGIPASTDG